jgi:hypothetical protein
MLQRARMLSMLCWETSYWVTPVLTRSFCTAAGWLHATLKLP